ncbi:MAG: DUF1674 domain-containing protein [Hyphomonadaceae bacterium]
MLVKASFPNLKKLVNVAAMSDETDDSDVARGAEDSPQAAGEQMQVTPGAAPGKALSAEAIRALQEAEARRQAAPRQELPTEINGRREGEEPTRYGDWEKKGLAVDF